MNKLIELLNEYDGYSIEYSGEGFIQNGKTISMVRKFEDCPGFTYYENWDSNLISKQFGFIKRLVDNDKIDFNKLQDNSEYYGVDFMDNYKDLLALLAVQDNPVEVLISILK